MEFALKTTFSSIEKHSNYPEDLIVFNNINVEYEYIVKIDLEMGLKDGKEGFIPNITDINFKNIKIEGCGLYDNFTNLFEVEPTDFPEDEWEFEIEDYELDGIEIYFTRIHFDFETKKIYLS